MEKDNITPWASFTRRIPLRASIAEIYRAWATPAGLESWFLRSAQFKSPDDQVRGATEAVQAGDHFVWLWHGWGDDHPEKKIVHAANGRDTFEFFFTADCLVSVKIFEEQGENMLELRQSRIPESNDPTQNLHLLCSNGWTFYLTNLKSILEGGIDLRNKDLAIKEVVNA